MPNGYAWLETFIVGVSLCYPGAPAVHPSSGKEYHFLGTLLSPHSSMPSSILRFLSPAIKARSLAGLLVMLGLTCSAAGAPPSPGRIPILAWGGPPESETSAARYRELADAGFTHNFSGFSSIAKMTEALNVAQAAGIMQFVSIPELEKSPEDVARRLKEHPALAGYYLRDEPPASEFEKLGAWAQRIVAVDPAHPCYLNLFPNYATVEQLGTATYPEYVAQFIAKIPVKFISFDHYPVTGDSLRAEWYENLEQVSSAAREAGKPFWAFALAVAHNPYPVATLAHLRLQVFSNLAYGAQGIQYFTYWTSKSDVWNFHEAPIGTDGKKTVVYDRVKQVNSEIRGLTPVFLHSKVLHHDHTGALPRGTHAYKPEAPLAGIKTEAAGALVSHLANGKRRFLAIVNRDFLKDMPLTVTLDGSAKVSEFGKNGTTEEISGREWTRSLAPGDIAVLTWEAKE